MTFSLIRGRRLRVTKLDGCGSPVLSPTSVVVTKGFISVGLSANTEEGESISVTNANGDICISDIPAPKITGYGIEIALCGVDPILVNLLTGQRIVYDGTTPTPVAVGFRVNTKVDLDASGFAIELWSGVPSAACQPGVSQSYGYLLIPFVKGGVLGDFTVENGPVNFTITGAQSKDGSSWGVGPYNVVYSTGTTLSPLLVAIDPADHLHVQLTGVAPPAEGVSALGVPATGAVATTGAYTPANSYGPYSLADLVAGTPNVVVASPNTAWTTGQKILLRDGTYARWNGTTWVATT